MGTPEFAVDSLRAIHQSIHEVVAVVTVADKPAGRGKKLRASAVKEYAQQEGIPLLQPLKLKDPDFLSALKSYQADVFVVVAFRMLPKDVWAMPPLGTFNLHASLLPQYRGAAPINWAIINGEKQSGVSTFMIDEEIDTGRIIYQKQVDIAPDDNAGHLHDKLMEEGSQLVLQTLDALSGEKIDLKKQESLIDNPDLLKPAPKLFPEDCKIDWNQTAQKIHNHIRGLSPYPAAFTFLLSEGEKPKKVKIFATRLVQHPDSGLQAGEFVLDASGKWLVKCADAMLSLEELQLEGKKRMPIRDFLNGFRLPEGAKFTS